MKSFLIILVIILLGGLIWFATSSNSEEAMEDNFVSDDSMMQEDESTMDPEPEQSSVQGDDEMMMKAGSYESYGPEKLAKANSGDVVLFFNATWCPTCKALDANIKANLDSIPSDLTILSVDYDTYTELKQKYGVTYQHTFVQVDGSGNQIKKWSGSPTLASLVTEVQ